MTDLRREIRFEKARDCTEKCAFGSPRCQGPNSSGFHGIHGVDMRFMLFGPEIATQFVIFTNWFPDKTKTRLEDSIFAGPRFSLSMGQIASLHFGPMAADLGYHSLKPTYENQYKHDKCEYFDGKPCYYDGSGLNAEDLFEKFVIEGDEAVWNRLKEYYNYVEQQVKEFNGN